MICLLCHILVGASYRAKLIVQYHGDVCGPILPSLELYATDFDKGLFDCLQGSGVIKRNLMACCCAPVYYAVDAAATDFMGFWLALVLTSIFIPILWVFGFITRMHIRDIFKMKGKILSDLCAWFLCCTCALIQEHRFIHRGFQAYKEKKRGYEIQTLEAQAKPVIPSTAATSSQPNAHSPSTV